MLIMQVALSVGQGSESGGPVNRTSSAIEILTLTLTRCLNGRGLKRPHLKSAAGGAT